MTAMPTSEWLLCNPPQADPRILTLRRAMDDFYRTSTDYTAFHEPAVKTREWAMMDSAIDGVIAARGRARVLELGRRHNRLPTARCRPTRDDRVSLPGRDAG